MTKNKDNYVVIMAGGVGSRFWPMSKKSYPKQFHDILGVGKSLIRLTYDRYSSFIPKENIYVITNASYHLLVQHHLPMLPEENIINEPAPMNTAPCVAYASFKIFSKNKNANIVFSPSDHLIIDLISFQNDIKNGLKFTENNDSLLTLSIKPDRPDTGYGYIQFIKDKKSEDIFKVKTFTEKPTQELAQTFIETGEFYWNSGIFIWKAATILNEFEIHQNEMFQIFKKGSSKYNTSKEQEFINKQYPLCKNISIDYAIMEKTKLAYTLLSDFGWSDIGTWKSLFLLREKDENNNMIHGENVETFNCKNSIVFSENENQKLVVVEGLTNAMVIDTDDVLFISSVDKEQEVKEITNQIKLKYKGKFT